MFRGRRLHANEKFLPDALTDIARLDFLTSRRSERASGFLVTPEPIRSMIATKGVGMVTYSRILALALSSIVVACGASRAPGSSADESGQSSGVGITADGGTKLDVGGADASGGDGNPEGGAANCKKVDILFVIDNSQSFEDEQVNLVASFPGFIDTLQADLDAIDSYHVGITTTDANECLAAPCDVAGALVTETCGDFSSNMTCGPYAQGGRFMTENDDLSATFACAAQVGTDGSFSEQPMYTLGQAISPELNAPGACNEGFIRDDALLVVVVITDEEDDPATSDCKMRSGSAGDPGDWFDTVVGHKGGIESNVVVLSLVGTPAPDECPPRNCGDSDGAEICHRILEFTSMFTHGFVGKVCAPSYDQFFAEAVGVISSACDDFTPVG